MENLSHGLAIIVPLFYYSMLSFARMDRTADTSAAVAIIKVAPAEVDA
jgi:hypothetical protein